MKKILLICMIAALVVSIAAAKAPNAGDGIPDGSGIVDKSGAPNSGDGISDGSGWDKTTGAPNSGDGISDGSGW